MLLLLSLFLVSCQTCPECPKADCPDPSLTLQQWESTLLTPYLEDIRKGVRLFGDQGFGICGGTKECDNFLGREAENLPQGDYFVKGEFAVPQVGQGWTVKFKVNCTLTDDKGNTTTQDHDRSYDVKYAGKERAYRIQPLWRIQSPHPNGARACTYSLTPVRPDGTEGEVWNGKYSTPAPPPKQ